MKKILFPVLLISSLLVVGCSHNETVAPTDGLPEVAESSGAMQPLSSETPLPDAGLEGRKEAIPSTVSTPPPMPVESSVKSSVVKQKRSKKHKKHARRKHSKKKHLARRHRRIHKSME